MRNNIEKKECELCRTCCNCKREEKPHIHRGSEIELLCFWCKERRIKDVDDQ